MRQRQRRGSAVADQFHPLDVQHQRCRQGDCTDHLNRACPGRQRRRDLGFGGRLGVRLPHRTPGARRRRGRKPNGFVPALHANLASERRHHRAAGRSVRPGCRCVRPIPVELGKLPDTGRRVRFKSPISIESQQGIRFRDQVVLSRRRLVQLDCPAHVRRDLLNLHCHSIQPALD